MSRCPRRLLGTLGVLAVVVVAAACQAYAGPRPPRAGGPYGQGGSDHGATHGATTWTPLARDRTPAQATSTTRRTGSPPRRLTPRRRPATRVPQVPGHQREGGKTVALTFDDGPGRDTADVLRVLRREQVPATFFVLGRNVVERQGDVRALARAGMSVQSHTWDHRDLTSLGDEHVDAELRRTSRAIERTTGTRPTCVRPPFGATDRRVQRRVAHARQVPVTWNVDTGDWAEPGSETIARRAVSGAEPGAIVLMHDGGGSREQTVAALPRVIRQLRAKGYTFTTLCARGRPGRP